MDTKNRTVLLRIYISSTDKVKDQVLYESLVLRAKSHGLAGATAVKGVLGYGASSVIHSYKFWEITEKVPVVIDFVDTEEKVHSFYETIRKELEEMRYGCLVTVSPVEILLSKPGRKG